MTKALTKSEAKELAECEAVIDKGLNSFFNVGEALFTIRDKKLYRNNHTDFQAYCDGKWGFTPQQNRYLIGEAYSERKKAKGAPSGNKNAVNTEEKQMGHSEPFVSTADEVAAEFNVSVPTVKRSEKYKQALDIISSVNSKAVGDIKAGTLAISDKDVIKIAKLHESKIGPCILNVKQGRKWNDDGKPKESLGKCPVCAGAKWTEDMDGFTCSKCGQPHGEPAGDVDEDRVKTQRQKTVNTVDAAIRAFDDLHTVLPKIAEHDESIAMCKTLLKTAKGWK